MSSNQVKPTIGTPTYFREKLVIAFIESIKKMLKFSLNY